MPSRSRGRCSPVASSSGSTARRRRPQRPAHRRPAADFALDQPLSPFALAALDLLDQRLAHLRARRRVRHRGDARGSAPGDLRTAQQGARRSRGRDEGRGHRVRRADGAARRGHPPAAAGRAARGGVRDLPQRPSVGRRPRAAPEVGRPRHVRAGDDVRRVRRLLRAGPVRGAGAALPRRRLPGVASDRPGVGAQRRARRLHRVARRADPAGRLVPARRVGEARGRR